MSFWLRRQTALTPVVQQSIALYSFIHSPIASIWRAPCSSDIYWSTDVLNRKEFVEILVGDESGEGISRERRVHLRKNNFFEISTEVYRQLIRSPTLWSIGESWSRNTVRKRRPVIKQTILLLKTSRNK